MLSCALELLAKQNSNEKQCVSIVHVMVGTTNGGNT